MGARMHVATQWNNGADAWLHCRCGAWESYAGDSMRSQRAAHRAHRVEMGETVAPPRPSVFDRLKAAEATIARVSAVHHVHRCEEDGHVLDHTPTPCTSDGYCSCGQPGDRCPTRTALNKPMEASAEPEDGT